MPLNVTENELAEEGKAAAVLSLRLKGDFYPLMVKAVRHETRDAAVLVFDVPSELREIFTFIQGQYLTIRTALDSESIRRSYSICSAVQDGVLRIVVKRASGGVFSNWILDHVNAGDILEVMPPAGNFYVPLKAEHKKHYIAFAVGSGITPIFSIVKTTLLAEPNSSFTLFYGNRASGSVILREELADLKDRFLSRLVVVHVMSREHQVVDLLNGRIDGEKAQELLRQFCPLEHVDVVFLCGPHDLVQTITAVLRDSGFPSDRIKIEHFAPKTDAQRRLISKCDVAKPHSSHVTVTLDGGQQPFTMSQGGETLLDGAIRAGIDVRYSCKSGVCATCRAKLINGQVDMDANYALEDYEIARGFILTCQSYPVSSEIAIDFDQDN
jgi:ring-1,2-phenylacetyl-CoA epoxidase subunit PaaE